MCSNVKDIFNAVAKAISSLWSAVRPYMAYLTIVAAVFAPYLAPMLAAYLPASVVSAIAGLSAGTFLAAETLTAMAWRGLVGLALAYMVDSETASGVVADAGALVADVVGDAAEVVAGVVGSGIGGAFSGLLGSPLGLAAVGLGAMWLFGFFDEKEEDKGGRLQVPGTPPKGPSLTEDFGGY